MQNLGGSAGTWLALVAALCACMVPTLATGCTQTCEEECADQYDDCLARAPPGASKADCAAQYDQCITSCQASADAVEDDPR